MIRTVTWIDADAVSWPLTVAGEALLLAGGSGLDASPVDVQTDERASDGAVLSAVRSPARTIILPVHFNDFDTLDAMAEAFIGRPSILQVANGTRTRQLLDVYYVGGLEGDHADANEQDYTADFWRNRVLELKALDPYWYSTAKAVTLEPGVDIGAGTAWDAAISWNAAIPWNGGSIITLDVDSRVGAWPVFTVVGPTTFFEIVHLRTGQAVRLATGYTIGAGQSMIIDSRPASRGITLGGIPAWTHVTPESDPALEVRLGDNLSMVMEGTTGASEIQVSFRERWRMP